MPDRLLPPPLTEFDDLERTLREQGFAVLAPHNVCRMSGVHSLDLQALASAWNDLPADRYLKDGGRYRSRRHASVVLYTDRVHSVPHRAHWQPLSYNALHGGMQRWFEPVAPAVQAQAAWQQLLLGLAQCVNRLSGARPWFTEVHQFRIDTQGGIGRPTPEGAHRDGVDWVAVFLLARQGIKGGETRVFDMHSPRGQRFTLTQPWSLLLLNDQKVMHETTPIQPEGTEIGWRDTLVVTLRAEGFLDEPTAQPLTHAG